MKSLLKLIGVLTLTTGATTSVVACPSFDNNKMEQKDIRNAAASLIMDTNVNMKKNFELDEVALNNMENKTFSELEPEIQAVINTFFSLKVTKNSNLHSSNWHYDSAQIKISDAVDTDLIKNNKNKFNFPVSSKVNGNIYLRVQITYKESDPVNKNIKLTINNDVSSVKQKLTAINSYLKTKINTLDLEVEELPPRIAGAESYMMNNIKQPLRTAILKLVDYSELIIDFSVKKDPRGNNVSIFEMLKPNKELPSFNGKLNNIIVLLTIGTENKSSMINITTNDIDLKINIKQDNNSAITKIQEMFKTNSISVSSFFDKNWSAEPVPLDEKLKEQIKLSIFNRINKYYKVIDSINDEDVTDIKDVTDWEISFLGDLPANINGLDENNASFSLNFKLTYSNPFLIPFEVNVENSTINVKKNNIMINNK